MPMCVVACSPMHWHTFPLIYSGPQGPDKYGKQSMPIGAAACRPTHWHSVPVLVWAMCHFSSGDTWHAVTHMADISRTCLKAMCHLFSDTWPRQVGHKYAHALGCMQPHVWQTFALLFWAMWPRILMERYANVWSCMQCHSFAYFPLILLCNVAHTSRG